MLLFKSQFKFSKRVLMQFFFESEDFIWLFLKFLSSKFELLRECSHNRFSHFHNRFLYFSFSRLSQTFHFFFKLTLSFFSKLSNFLLFHILIPFFLYYLSLWKFIIKIPLLFLDFELKFSKDCFFSLVDVFLQRSHFKLFINQFFLLFLLFFQNSHKVVIRESFLKLSELFLESSLYLYHIWLKLHFQRTHSPLQIIFTLFSMSCHLLWLLSLQCLLLFSFHRPVLFLQLMLQSLKSPLALCLQSVSLPLYLHLLIFL